MPYAIDIPPMLLALMEELPRRSRAAIHSTLEQLAELAVLWPADDLRWERLTQRDGEELRFYADGCCVRVQLQPEAQRLRVKEIGRVLVHLPPGLSLERNLVGSPVEH